MAIFNNKQNSYTELPVVEGYGHDSGLIQACIESFDDQLLVMEAIHAMDMAEIEADAKTKEAEDEDEKEEIKESYSIVAESLVKDVWAKMLATMKKLLAKIKDFFKAARRMFDGMFMSGKDFVKKYKASLEKLDNDGKLKGYKVKMFTYKVDKSDVEPMISRATGYGIDACATATSTVAQYDIQKLETERDTLTAEKYTDDNIRGAILSSSRLSSDEFATKLWQHFRSGARTQEDKKEVSVNIRDIIKWLENDNDIMSVIKDTESDMTDTLDVAIKAIEKMRDKQEEDTEDATAQKRRGIKVAILNKQNAIVSRTTSIASGIFQAWKSAVTEKNSACKSVCTHAFSFKAEK